MRYVTLDYDVKFESFRESVLFAKVRGYCFLHNITSIYMRRSASGNTHVMIPLKFEMSLFETILVRRYLKDDETRILLDLDRFYRTLMVNKTGRLWDFKIYSDGSMGRVGMWRKVEV